MSKLGNINVVKIGGNVIDNDAALQQFVADFAALPSPKILVHGGGRLATRMCEKLEIPQQMIEGRRCTNAATLEVVTMVYAGLVNKRIVAALQAEGCRAIGLSGADADVVRAVRRKAEPIDYGFVGDINPAAIKIDFVSMLLEAGIVPVFCSIMHDGNGTLLNCNADSVASAVAIAASRIGNVNLQLCFEKKGVMQDVSDDTSLIPKITPANYVALRESGTVNSGMIPKIENAFAALRQGVGSVIIKHSAELCNPSAGTLIVSED